MQGDTLVIGAQTDNFGALLHTGSTYVCTRADNTKNWAVVTSARATNSSTNQIYGAVVNLNGDTLGVSGWGTLNSTGEVFILK